MTAHPSHPSTNATAANTTIITSTNAPICERRRIDHLPRLQSPRISHSTTLSSTALATISYPQSHHIASPSR